MVLEGMCAFGSFMYCQFLGALIVRFICISALSHVFECHRNTEKEEEEKKEKKEKNKERKEKERKQRKEEEEDGEGGWERVKGGIIPLVSKVALFNDGLPLHFFKYNTYLNKMSHVCVSQK